MRILLLASFLLPLAFGALPAQADAPQETLVTTDTVWREREVDVQALRVVAPAVLRLEGTTLTIEDWVLVDEGARLELGPAADRPTILEGTTAVADEQNGWWMRVQGTLTSSGTPRTEVTGLRGTGLTNLYFDDGGIRVAGRAELADLHLHDGNGTLIGMPGSFLRLERSLVEDMGFMGVGTRAPLEVRNSTLRGSGYGIMGRDACTYDVADSVVEATGTAIQANGCRVDVVRTRLAGANTGLQASGSAVVHVSHSAIEGYRTQGVWAGRLLSPNGTGASPLVVLSDVDITPDPGARSAQGIFMRGATGEFSACHVSGNAIGITASDGSLLGMTGCTVVRNEAIGVMAVESGLAGDLLVGNDFGNATAGTANRIALEARFRVRAELLDSTGQPLEGVHLSIFSALDDQPIGVAVVMPGRDNATVFQDFLAYVPYLDGSAKFAGPFTYRIEHPALAAPIEGVLDLADPDITAHLPALAAASPPEASAPKASAPGGLLAMGLAAWAARRR